MKTYQVQDSDLTEAQREHLQYRLFPSLRAFRKTVRERLAAQGVA